MSDGPLRILVWNVQWARPDGSRGAHLLSAIKSARADVVCLTEGLEGFLPNDGFLVSSEADYGYPLRPGRRKVQLWSRRPWFHVDQIGDADLPGGRYVAGTTETPLGSVRILGVCVPWRDAHVRGGRRDRKPWEDHLSYLESLEQIIAREAEHDRLVVAGDFNQQIPRERQPRRVFEALRKAMDGQVAAVTAGPIRGIGRSSIDHVAVGPRWTARAVQGLSNVAPDGKSMSDHFGLCVDLAPA